MEETKALTDELADGVNIDLNDNDDLTEAEEMPTEAFELLTDENIIKALENPSEAVKNALQGIVNEAVKKALAKNTPKRTTVKTDPITKEQFSRMSYAERENLYNTNRPLYEKLRNY